MEKFPKNTAGIKYLWENKWFFVPMLVFFSMGGLLAWLIPYGQEIVWLNHARTEPFNTLFQGLTFGGEAWAYVVFGLLLLWLKPRFALIVAFTGILSMPLMYVLKDAIGMDRPFTYFEKRNALHEVVLVPEVEMNRGQTSFPSGHSMAGFALFGMLTLMLPRTYQKWGAAFATLAILVGISRIFLVQHFLVDVLAGGWLGLVMCSLVWMMAKRVSVRA